MRFLVLIPIFLMALTFASCKGDTPDKKEGAQTDSMKRERPIIQSDSARIISLPTPMQIPALLRNTHAIYNKELILPIISEDKPFFKSNVLFGMYMIDLAYSASYEDHQTTLKYFSKCKQLGDDMGLGLTVETKLANRFEHNIERPDSLGRIILEMYKIGHSYFNENDKEGVGLVMIMGCLMEGLHLGFEQARQHDLVLFLHILSQHKQYTSNLIYALDGYEIPSEIQHEYDLLLKLESMFELLNPPSAYELKTNQATSMDINEEMILEMSSLVEEFRRSIAI